MVRREVLRSMRRSLFAVLGAVALAVAYIATPFVAAWSIREAMQNGNSDYLEHKIEWDRVRETLRESTHSGRTRTGG